MKKLRILLYPFMALAELMLLAVCWAIAMVRPSRAERIADWAIRTFPDPGWYIGRDAKPAQPKNS